jgi:hypothetical protein
LRREDGREQRRPAATVDAERSLLERLHQSQYHRGEFVRFLGLASVGRSMYLSSILFVASGAEESPHRLRVRAASGNVKVRRN